MRPLELTVFALVGETRCKTRGGWGATVFSHLWSSLHENGCLQHAPLRQAISRRSETALERGIHSRVRLLRSIARSADCNAGAGLRGSVCVRQRSTGCARTAGVACERRARRAAALRRLQQYRPSCRQGAGFLRRTRAGLLARSSGRAHPGTGHDAQPPDAPCLQPRARGQLHAQWPARPHLARQDGGPDRAGQDRAGNCAYFSGDELRCAGLRSLSHAWLRDARAAGRTGDPVRTLGYRLAALPADASNATPDR